MPDHSKYITTPDFNKLTAESFTPQLKQANLATKGDIAGFVEKADFDDKLKVKLKKKVTSKKSKHSLVKNELKKKTGTYNRKIINKWFKSFYSSKLLFHNGTQLYLTFQPLYYTLKTLGDT